MEQGGPKYGLAKGIAAWLGIIAVAVVIAQVAAVWPYVLAVVFGPPFIALIWAAVTGRLTTGR